jgi:hypothetical protein
MIGAVWNVDYLWGEEIPVIFISMFFLFAVVLYIVLIMITGNLIA